MKSIKSGVHRFLLGNYQAKNFPNKMKGEISMPKRCVIWGAGENYETIINQIKFEELKGNLECVAILSKSTARFAKKYDGYDVISKEELNDIGFDCLIITVEKYYEEILAEALAMGIPRKKVINGRVLKIPNFDFRRYSSLRENPITILSDDCWGGYVYHNLDLPFTSPLINIYWPRDSYCKFIQDPIFYLEQPLCKERDGVPRENIFPIGRLGEGNQSVQLHFVHARSFQEAKELWDRRRKRININRIFIKFGFSADEPRREEYLAVFGRLPYHKVCVYSGETDIEDVFYSKRFEWDWYHAKRLDLVCFNDWCRQVYNSLKVLDILKLLNGEKDYMREL